MAQIEEIILSLNVIPGLTEAQRDSLKRLGIQRVSDLLHFQPVHHAQLIAALAAGRVVHDFEIAAIVDAAHAGKSVAKLMALSTDVLAGVGQVAAEELAKNFGVRTVADLAVFAPFVQAQQVVAARANLFSEPASAPPELMPGIVGAVHNSHSFSSFVKEKTLDLPGVELLYDEDRIHFIDDRLAALFPVRGLGPIFTAASFAKKGSSGTSGIKFQKIPTPEPQIHLGYAARLRQDWVNMGTFLGELQHSLALAPGESRNIATIDWKRRHLTRREEDTKVKELLANDLVHTRALDEVARSTAFEHQFGGTGIAAGTAAGSAANVVGAALVGGVATAIPLAAVGALAGGIVGSAAPAVGNAIGAAAGAAGGAVIGFGMGAAAAGGLALLASGNAQLGVIRSDSTGSREVLAEMAQDITETTSQKSSSIRSLWSTVFVSDTQAENESLQTRNVTNYNHSHALTIQYYEVLQHYRTEVHVAAAEPLLFLPFRPLEFTLDLIADYWTILRTGIADHDTRHRYDQVLAQFDTRTDTFTLVDQDRLVDILVNVERAGFGPYSFGVPEVRLLGISPPMTKTGAHVRFPFADEVRQASQVTGVQVRGLIRNESVRVSVRMRVESPDASERFVNRSSDRLLADDDGRIRFDFGVPGIGPSAEELQAWGDEIARFFNAQRYQFTRVLLLSLEREQLIDLVEALILRRAFEVDLMQPSLRPQPGVPSVLPGFSAKKPTLGAALGEAARNKVRQSILGDVVRRHAAAAPATLAKVDTAIAEIADRLRGAGALPAVQRDAALTEALAPLSSALKAEGLADETEIVKRAKELLAKLAGQLDDNASLFEEAIPLTAFVDPSPFAITGNTLVFRMCKPPAEVAARKLVTDTQLREAAAFVDNLRSFVAKELDRRTPVVRDVYLPTSGVFAEALLGRANASEKIDITRFFNWQDSPIPHLAPAINALTAGSRRAEPLATDVNIPGNVLNVSTPATFPDPTGMSAALSAIQNGNMFRDMSKSDQLVTVMANLSNLAQSMAQQAGSLAGQAQAEALKSATEIGKLVAQLASQAASQPANLPSTRTDQGGAANILDKLKASPNPSPLDDEIKGVIGVPPRPVPPIPYHPTIPAPISVPETEDDELPEGSITTQDVEIKLRIFSQEPAELIIPTSPLGGQGLMAVQGDNRDFSYDQGSSRLDLTLTMQVDITNMLVLGDPVVSKGHPPLRAIFDVGDFEALPNAGAGRIPAYAGRPKPGTSPLRISQIFNDKDTIQAKVYKSPSHSDEITVNLKVDANLFVPPIELPSFIPMVDKIESVFDFLVSSTDVDISIVLKREVGDRLKAIINGSHDGFPAYEVYVNRIQAYKFDSIGEGKDTRARSGEPIEMTQPFLVPRLRS